MLPLYRDQILGVLRHFLTIGAGMLITHGMLTTALVSPELIAGAAVALLTIGMSMYQKFTARRVLVTALAYPVPATEALVQSKIDLGMPVPSVLTPPDVVPVPVRLHG